MFLRKSLRPKAVRANGTVDQLAESFFFRRSVIGRSKEPDDHAERTAQVNQAQPEYRDFSLQGAQTVALPL